MPTSETENQLGSRPECCGVYIPPLQDRVLSQADPMSTGIPLVLLESGHGTPIQCPGPRGTGSLAPHHCLGKYWHFVLCGKNPTLCIQAEREKEKQGEGAKCFCLFQSPQTKGKRTPSFKKLKEKDLSLIADLSAL